MANLSTTTADTAHTLLDFNVVDQSGSDIGTVHSFWADTQSGNLEFIGVKTGWLFGHNHVVPVDKVETDEANRTVRLPYDAEFIKNAMSIDADSEITDEQEAEIYRYYGLGGGTSRTGYTSGSTTTGTTHTGTGMAAANVGAAYDASTESASTIGTARDTATAGTAIDTAGINLAGTGTGRTAGVAGGEERDITLREEQLKVGKRTVDAGQVRLRKIVRTEIVNQPVEVRREDVVVERVSADQVHADQGSTNFEEEVINVPLTREEAVVSKEATVTGAVRLHKTADVETQNVSDTVRKEDVEVTRDGKTVTESHESSKA